MPVRSFPSKVDWWLGLILLVAPVLSVGGAIIALKAGSYSGIAPVVLLVLIYGGLVWPIRYEIHDDHLLIRFGLMRSKVPYKDIREVHPTNNPISSPALSLSRLHVDTGNAIGPNISPADRAGFLAALAEKTPHLVLRGEKLEPR